MLAATAYKTDGWSPADSTAEQAEGGIQSTKVAGLYGTEQAYVSAASHQNRNQPLANTARWPLSTSTCSTLG